MILLTLRFIPALLILRFIPTLLMLYVFEHSAQETDTIWRVMEISYTLLAVCLVGFFLTLEITRLHYSDWLTSLGSGAYVLVTLVEVIGLFWLGFDLFAVLLILSTPYIWVIIQGD